MKLIQFISARLWTIFTVLLVLTMLMALWVITPSTILFRPVEWRYDPATGTATFTRVVSSRRPVTVRWAHIIYVPGGASCSSGGTRPYDNRIKVETFEITDDMRRCLDDPSNVAVLTWSPLLWGVVPLRPYVLTVPAGAEIPR